MLSATGREATPEEEVDEITEAKVRAVYRYADAMLEARK
jgi:hypothetical protein